MLAAKVGKLESLVNANGIALPGTPVRQMLDEEKGVASRTRTDSGERRSRSSSLKGVTRKALGRDSSSTG